MRTALALSLITGKPFRIENIRVRVKPVIALAPLVLAERGAIRDRRACAAVSNLPLGIARRELKVVDDKLGWPPSCLQAIALENFRGSGNVLTIAIESDALTEVFTGFGRRGVAAETVAAGAAGQALDYSK
jgi:RNA 3'-terminal phosphate cyclase (ATP)